jgi:hypothetical protein
MTEIEEEIEAAAMFKPVIMAMPTDEAGLRQECPKTPFPLSGLRRHPREKTVNMSHEVKTEQEIRLELYRALIAAVDHLDGEVRLIALAAIAKAEGREEA